MKKKILIALLLVILAIVGALAYVATNASSIIAQFKPQLEEQASLALGAKVSLENLSLSVFPSTKIAVEKLHIRSGDEKGFELKGVSLSANLMPLLNHRLEITKLLIDGPQIKLIKDENGVAIDGLPKQTAKANSDSGARASLAKPQTQGEKSAPIAVSLDSFELKNGNIIFEDRLAKKEYAFTNLSVESKIELGSDLVTLPSLVVKTKAPQNIDLTLRSEKINYALSSGTVDIQSLNLSTNLNGQPVAVNAALKLDGPTQDLKVQPIKVEAFSGTIDGLFALILKDQMLPFSTDLKLNGMDISKALAAIPGGAPAKITGKLNKFNALLNGPLGGDIKAKLNGTMDVEFKDGALIGVNIAAQVIDALSQLAFLKGGSANDGSSALTSNDTSIKSLTALFTVGGGGLQTQNLNLLSDIFSLQGSGRVGFDSHLDLKTTIYFNQQFSASLVGKVKELKNVLDAQGQLVIPLQITGVPPSVTVLPNFDKLLEIGATKALQEGATKFLENGLKKKGLGKLFGF